MLTLRQGVRFTLTLWTLGCLTTMTSFSAQAANVSVTDTDGIPLEKRRSGGLLPACRA